MNHSAPLQLWGQGSKPRIPTCLTFIPFLSKERTSSPAVAVSSWKPFLSSCSEGKSHLGKKKKKKKSAEQASWILLLSLMVQNGWAGLLKSSTSLKQLTFGSSILSLSAYLGAVVGFLSSLYCPRLPLCSVWETWQHHAFTGTHLDGV